MGQGDGGRQGLARRYDAVGQPDLERLGGWHGPTGQDQVHGAAVADEAGEADRAEVAQRDAEAAAEDPEDGVLGGHPQVAPEGELDAAGHGVALDGGDDRFGKREAGRAHGAAAPSGMGRRSPSALP